MSSGGDAAEPVGDTGGNPTTAAAGTTTAGSPAQVGGGTAASAGASDAGEQSGGNANAGAAAAPAGGESGGSGGTSSAAGGAAMGGAEPSPMPSPGCALASPTVPDDIGLGGVDPYSSMNPGWIRPNLPTSYDGVTPVPLLLTLHSTGGYSDGRYLVKDAANAQHYLIAEGQAPQSIDTFESVDPAHFTELFNKLLATVCVDLNRLFAVGNGSGGRFMMYWLAGRAGAPTVPAFRAVAVVGTYQHEPTPKPLPLLFLHPLSSLNSRGVAQDEDGMKGFGLLMKANQCSDDTNVPFAAEGCTKGAINPGCIDLVRCAAPLRFCHHDENVTVGDPWPCFGASAVYQFFDDYRGY